MPYAFKSLFMTVAKVVVEPDVTEGVIFNVWEPALKKPTVQASVLYHGHGFAVSV